MDTRSVKRLFYSFLKFYITILSSLFTVGCSPFVTKFIIRSLGDIAVSPDTIKERITNPVLPHAGLAILWIGHSTCLIQIEDKIFITDPIFTKTAGMISKRKVEPGIFPSSINKLDYILISHLHFDHLSYGSLEMLPKSAVVILPPGGSRYTPEFGFADYRELGPGTTFETDGLRITAVPVKHFNGRYGFDIAWLNKNTFTGYIIEYKGKTVFFAGDTGYDPEIFKDIGRKFKIDLALIPIAPVEPRDFMKRVHADFLEAVQIFNDIEAKIMIPIHHLTFTQGTDSSLSFAQDQLKLLAKERKMEERINILNIGEQYIFIP